jgi:hypothetical protein
MLRVSAPEADAMTAQEAPMKTDISERNATVRMVENACMLILFFVFASASSIAKSVPKLQSYDFQRKVENVRGVRFCTIQKKCAKSHTPLCESAHSLPSGGKNISLGRKKKLASVFAFVLNAVTLPPS